jgi:uncharacterized RDD family membrane protein YckC
MRSLPQTGFRIANRRGALARDVAKLVSDLTLAIGYVMAAFTSRKQALHDIVTGCVLIKHQV